jgi:DNA mismatch repair protein MutS
MVNAHHDVAPSVEAARDGSYPIARPLFMYSRGQPTGEIKKYLDWVLSDDGQRILLEHFSLASLDGLGAAGQSLSICAAGALIHYLQDSQLAQLGKAASLRFFESSDFMKLDGSTVTNLELVQTLNGSKKGSLLSFLDLTRTGMGARLLKSYCFTIF